MQSRQRLSSNIRNNSIRITHHRAWQAFQGKIFLPQHYRSMAYCIRRLGTFLRFAAISHESLSALARIMSYAESVVLAHWHTLVVASYVLHGHLPCSVNTSYGHVAQGLVRLDSHATDMLAASRVCIHNLKIQYIYTLKINYEYTIYIYDYIYWYIVIL